MTATPAPLLAALPADAVLELLEAGSRTRADAAREELKLVVAWAAAHPAPGAARPRGSPLRRPAHRAGGTRRPCGQ